MSCSSAGHNVIAELRKTCEPSHADDGRADQAVASCQRRCQCERLRLREGRRRCALRDRPPTSNRPPLRRGVGGVGAQVIRAAQSAIARLPHAQRLFPPPTLRSPARPQAQGLFSPRALRSPARAPPSPLFKGGAWGGPALRCSRRSVAPAHSKSWTLIFPTRSLSGCPRRAAERPAHRAPIGFP